MPARQETIAEQRSSSELLYANLTRDMVDRAAPQQAEQMLILCLAEMAHVQGKGKILSWSEFNENPDMLINTLLAKLMLHKIPKEILEGKEPRHIAVLSIENSAGYLATALALEIERQHKLPRPPRIIRARKSSSDSHTPSPAMGAYTSYATVYPITSDNQPRFLVASTSDTMDLSDIRVLFVVDDFRATGNTVRGGIEIALDLLRQTNAPLSETTILPVSGLGKPDQETDASFAESQARVMGVVTGIDVHFWPDHKTGKAFIQANSFAPYEMHKANASNFPNPLDTPLDSR